MITFYHIIENKSVVNMLVSTDYFAVVLDTKITILEASANRVHLFGRYYANQGLYHYYWVSGASIAFDPRHEYIICTPAELLTHSDFYVRSEIKFYFDDLELFRLRVTNNISFDVKEVL